MVSATDEEKNTKMPLIFFDVSEVQEAVKAAQLVLKDVRAIFSEKAAANRELKAAAKPKPDSKAKAKPGAKKRANGKQPDK